MRLQVQLVHAESGVRVVLVSAWSGDDCLGSALGEAADAEEAERRAELRLRQRFGADQAPPAAAATDAAPPASAGPPLLVDNHRPIPREPLVLPAPPVPRSPSAEPRPQPPAGASAAVPMADPEAEPSPDPDDWSDDLARIDLELLRLGWSRSQEAIYLERAFGHPSRSRLTRYGDLIAYLQSLAGLEAGAEPAEVTLPLRRQDLLQQCDELLARLGWEPDQGRSFLDTHFQCSSRQHLTDQQLLQFNMLLEEQWLMQPSLSPADDVPPPLAPTV